MAELEVVALKFDIMWKKSKKTTLQRTNKVVYYKKILKKIMPPKKKKEEKNMIIIKIISLILILIGVTFTYDARILSINWFSFGDQNEATTRTKNFRIYNCNNRSNDVL